MARLITGSFWAFAVIEQMEKAIRAALRIPEPQTANQDPKTTLAPRSCQDDSRIVLAREQPKGGHLRPSAGELYKVETSRDLRDLKPNRNAPRPKIVVIDMAWRDAANPKFPKNFVMPEKVSFVTPECRDINKRRSQTWGTVPRRVRANENSDLEQQDVHRNELLNPYDPHGNGATTSGILHGEALVGALRIGSRHPHYKQIRGKKPNDRDKRREWALWNLAPRADIVLLPLREHGEIKRDTFTNALGVSHQSEILNKQESSLLNDPHLLNLLNATSKSDNSRSFWLLRKNFFAAISKQFLVYLISESTDVEREDQKGEEATTDLEDFFAAYCDHAEVKASEFSMLDEDGRMEVIAKLQDLMRRFFGALVYAIEEAGLVETFGVLDEACSEGGIGIGDTVVAPLQIDILNKNPKRNHQYQDVAFNIEDFLTCELSDGGSEVGEEARSRLMAIELPIITYTRVEAEVRKITTQHKVSVVVSAGNSYLDLNQIKMRELDRILPTRRFPKEMSDHDARFAERGLFHGRAASCGAIVVGSGAANLAHHWIDPLSKRTTCGGEAAKQRSAKVARYFDRFANADVPTKRGDPKFGFANYGTAVDAYGRGSTRDVDRLIERHGAGSTMVSQEVYEHWGGASIASIITASCIANVQHIRMLHDYLTVVIKGKGPEEMVRPLKPYEVRSHLRHSRSLDCWRYDCLEDLMGPPPDIPAWFQMTAMEERLREFTDNNTLLAEAGWFNHLHNGD